MTDRGVITSLLTALCFAVPVSAELSPTSNPDESYSGICEMVEICNSTGGCAPFPALGELALEISGDSVRIGRLNDDLTPVELFNDLADAYPLSDIRHGRHEFLVRLAPNNVDRQYALYIQRPTAPGSAPRLQPRHFVMACTRVNE